VGKIKAKIEQYIADPAVSRIITHNNWGEYGHNQHRAVNRAVRELAVKYRKDVWMLGCDNGYFGDITVPSGITYTLGNFDGNLFNAIREIYLHPNNWWTWSLTDTPSGYHKFVKIVDAGYDKSNILKGDPITVSGPSQYIPGAYIFDGNDDYLTLDGNNYNSFTIAMWVRPDAIKSMDISKMAEYPLSGKYDRSFYMLGDGRITARINDGQFRSVTSSTALTAGNWTHIMMKGNGSTLRIYINGVLEATTSAGAAISNYASPEFVVGQAQETSAFFQGQISDVRLYDHPLTDSEVTSFFGAATPTYGIDFFNESTNRSVPSTDEYSYNADMSDAVSGNGHRLAIMPGRDVYFRTTAGDNRFASDIQHLAIPARLAGPWITIDYWSEKTSPVSATMEYSTNSSMTPAIAGENKAIPLTPGTDLYIVTAATESVFASYIQHLIVPERPSAPTVTIDFAKERTDQNIDSTLEYSASNTYTDPVSGNGDKIALIPGKDLYFWVKATSGSFYSTVTHLSVPVRPAKPSITIDFADEKTSSVSASMKYSTDSSMASAVDGGDTAISVTPGINLYFIMKATSGSFASAVQSLVVPGRPMTPDYQINTSTLTTMQPVLTSDEYSIHADMSGSLSGTNAILSFMPRTHVYFRTKVTGSSFCSAIQHIYVKKRSETPVFLIDYVNQTTAEAIDADAEYSADADFSSASSGTGLPVNLTPGQNLFFRMKGNDSTYASSIYMLDVPQKPFLEYTGEKNINTPLFTVKADLDENMTGFDLSDISVTNGHAQNLREENLFDVIPEHKGNVRVVIHPKSSGHPCFGSNTLAVYFKDLPTGFTDLDLNEVRVYPVPSSDGLINITANIPGQYVIEIFSPKGELIRDITANDRGIQTIDLHELKGIYFVRITAGNIQGIRKIILY
jgi:hypothetical protein